ncbi:ATPase [Salegentibacter salinarum]|uniref:ATPase n=1 Tax=Salegentibacter salinarum TaxID=447422 RepID=A0A2N0TVV5_9FLAO|nr:SRPBCC domain-containing protein [Salegentibacter salinarum]PKD18892.1 ATPase [Salegentibacter salinarum]SKB88932.1 Uncharacterized conserved protein YndB, AHSA1/START domain [Salegentibacter salinarum]
MNKNASLEFTVNKANNSIHIKREFDANLKQVWQAWTDPELLDKWWAPKPYHIETKSLNFEEGGRWLYAMVSPTNEKDWCKADYKKIAHLKSISWLDAFCDEEGNDTYGKPNSSWTNIFSEENGTTTVDITLQHESKADLEMVIQMGFKEGFSMALENLDKVLSNLNTP